MKFRLEREFFEFVCQAYRESGTDPKSVPTVAEELADEFDFCTDDEGFPMQMSYVVIRYFSIKETLGILCTYFGLDEVSDALYDKFLNCSLIDNGDCPECGGTMEYYQHSNEENEYGEMPYDEYICPICGRKEIR